MASPEILDLESLLSPISDENPAGADIRQDASPDSAYQTIKAARNAARAAERQHISEGPCTEADAQWRKIASLAPQILTRNAKDLEVASWLAEALVRQGGFQGLRDAFKLLHGLVAQYWDNLYPMPDEDGMETRVACVAGLNGEGAEGVLIAPIRKVDITQGEEPGPFSYWHYKMVLDAEKIADEDARKNKLKKLGYTLDDVEKSVAASSETFFVDLRDDLQVCIDEYKKLGQLLDEHCGIHDAPPTRTIIEVLEECLGAVNHLGRDKFPVEAEPEQTDTDSAAADADAPAQAAAPVAKGGPINSREAAFKQLEEIASYFRKTEPHSPISYVLEKALKWGNMSLAELIAELIPDASSRERFSELTGVRNDN